MSLTSRLNDWSGDIEPQVLSLELRKGRDEFLENRRKITGLNLVAAGAMGAIALYQMGSSTTSPSRTWRGSTRTRWTRPPRRTGS